VIEIPGPLDPGELKRHFDSFLPPWDGQQLLRAAEYVRSRAHHHLGGRVLGSRLAANAQLIASNLVVPHDHAVVQQRFDANRSTIEFFWIVRALDRGLICPDYRLERAVRGFPGRYAGGDTSPWDFQQELLWHSALVLGGIAGVRVEEPDLTIQAGEQRIALAIKRLSTLKGARSDERSREAARQIGRSGHPGAIILQIDPPELQLTATTQRGAYLDEIAERALELAAEHEPTARVYGALAYAVQGSRQVDKLGGETVVLQFHSAQRWREQNKANYVPLFESLADLGGRIAIGLAREVASFR